MNIIKIDSNNIELLKTFIGSKLSKYFRYFDKRDISCIKNHLITYIGLKNDIPIAYGHIDYSCDENKHWLGICILDNYQGFGYGKLLMNKLIEFLFNSKINNVYLCVDKNNIIAYNLYLKYGFEVINNSLTYYEMKLNIIK